ncbi:MAG: endonuclease MutS2 [Halanaerobiales bacterium]|nr:endonuclease MutS2 [Halanaerobiales bacterium]
MEGKILETLELNKIIEEVQEYAATELGNEIIGALSPSTDYHYIKRGLTEVTAGRMMLEEHGSPPFGGVRDIRSVMKKVAKGIVLSSRELIDVKTTIGGFKSLYNYFNEIIANLDPDSAKNQLTVVTEQGLKLIALPKLEKELERCLDEYGEVKNKASNRLASLRREMDGIGNRIRERMEGIVRGNKFKDMLQDNLITRRGDRYVVPVKHEYRNIFGGIIHDQSASGMTVFMEPLAIVKLNNRLRELKQEEEKEVYRILQELTALLGKEQHIVEDNMAITAQLDVVFARAEYSRKINGIAPTLNQQGMVRIVQGRHPLLKQGVVPLDLSVGEDFSTLVITGPNTGGKTVALKTIGLFVLMVETGFHLPAAPGTDIALFRQVFADIGDEQSIEQNLSTFSSHISRIKEFLEKADQDSLVLMDELGAGTDPREGAALGIAILDELRARKVTTVATTHYSELKGYAYTSKGVENASVEFDLETLRPTYRLLMGIPGGSNAFEIAYRLGIPVEIIEAGRGLISSKEIEIEEIITGLNEQRKKYQELRQSYEKKERETAELAGNYHSLLENLKAEKLEVVKLAREEAAQIVTTARKKAKNIIQGLKKADFNSRSALDRTAQQINEQLKGMETELTDRHRTEDAVVTGEIAIGDQVRLKKIGQQGEVLEIDREKQEVTIQAGIMRVKARRADLVKVELSEQQQQELVQHYRVSKTARVSPKIDLRGERYEIAQQRLDKYLDDVFLTGLKQVEIIHGKGTGALRVAVKDQLEKNPHVSSYRPGRQEEGGTGVTIAILAN